RLALALQLGLDALALGDLGDEGYRVDPIVRLHVAQADLDGKFCAVPPTPSQVQPRAHRSDAWPGEVTGAMLSVLLANAIRQQDLERLALELVVLIAEHAFGRSVCEGDATGGADQQDAFGGRLEDRLGGGFAPSKGAAGNDGLLEESPLGLLLLDGG